MDYLIRFVQMHESFRKPETDALAELLDIDIEWTAYTENSPFAIIRFSGSQDHLSAAKALISRSTLSSAIYELWGTGHDYPSLHQDVVSRSSHLWPLHSQKTFRFEVDAFQGSHTNQEQREIIESFSYTAFTGPIRMKDPDNQFVIFEDYDLNGLKPKQIHLGRLVAESGRKAINKYSLKKRSYIATTSMDAELSLVTANLAHAAEGKLCYDPFMGTGSFPLSCAHFGAVVCGSDLDGRSIRGTNKKGAKRSVLGNFEQYGTAPLYLGGFVADLTNTPLKVRRCLDSVLCDPPYGVREGLKVLGSHKPALQEEVLLEDGTPAHLSDSYLPPKKAYSFERMLDDILDFSASMLVDRGRLCMWMPVAGVTADGCVEDEGTGGEGKEFDIPQHPALELTSECTQHFNKWSRRLLTYRRRRNSEVHEDAMLAYQASRLALQNGNGIGTADELNSFRRKYFQGFVNPPHPRQPELLPQ